MKVILNTDISNLGEEGDILEVSPGYARNYLLPKQLVSMHNKASLAALESKKKAIMKRKEEKIESAKSTKERIHDKVLEFRMPAGDSGKLFGAVTSQMVVDALAAEGLQVERKMVEIPGHTLKDLGNYTIGIRLYGNEEAGLKIKVLREGDTEAEPAEATAEETPVEAATTETVAVEAPAEPAETVAEETAEKHEEESNAGE